MARFHGVNTAARFPRLDRPLTQWRSIRREDRRLRNALAQGRRPVVVYSHPKTASRSVEAALAADPANEVFHCHVLRPMHFTRGFEPRSGVLERGMVRHSEPTQWPLHRHLFAGDAPVHIVSLVRDPIATSISWLYFGVQRWLASWRKIEPSALSDDAWLEIFNDRFPKFGLWSWWEDEFIPVTGIDPRHAGFDAERGWSAYDASSKQVLVLSTHLDDEAKTTALREVFGSGVGQVGRRNTSASRAGDAQYTRVKNLIGADQTYGRTLLEHPWASVFFTADQLATFAQRWGIDAAHKVSET